MMFMPPVSWVPSTPNRIIRKQERIGTVDTPRFSSGDSLKLSHVPLPELMKTIEANLHDPIDVHVRAVAEGPEPSVEFAMTPKDYRDGPQYTHSETLPTMQLFVVKRGTTGIWGFGKPILSFTLMFPGRYSSGTYGIVNNVYTSGDYMYDAQQKFVPYDKKPLEPFTTIEMESGFKFRLSQFPRPYQANGELDQQIARFFVHLAKHTAKQPLVSKTLGVKL